MNVQVTDEISLSAPGEGDLAAMVDWLKSGEIQKTTLEIPYPYQENDARRLIEAAGDRSQRFGRLMDWAIRNQDGTLIGMISLKGNPTFCQGIDEIGFWLAPPYWGKGIMTQVLTSFSRLAFDIFRLQRLEAIVFESNAPSVAVVTKCGFVQGELIKCMKDNRSINAYRFILNRS